MILFLYYGTLFFMSIKWPPFPLWVHHVHKEIQGGLPYYDEHCLIQGDSSGLPCFKGESLSFEFFQEGPSLVIVGIKLVAEGHPLFAWILIDNSREIQKETQSCSIFWF